MRAGKEERNNILQKAITLYIADMKELELAEAKMSFMAVKEKGTYDDDNYEMQYGNNVEQLMQYTVCTLPPHDKWIDLREG